jgi:hypothetical protein
LWLISAEFDHLWIVATQHQRAEGALLAQLLRAPADTHNRNRRLEGRRFQISKLYFCLSIGFQVLKLDIKNVVTPAVFVRKVSHDLDEGADVFFCHVGMPNNLKVARSAAVHGLCQSEVAEHETAIVGDNGV